MDSTNKKEDSRSNLHMCRYQEFSGRPGEGGREGESSARVPRPTSTGPLRLRAEPDLRRIDTGKRLRGAGEGIRKGFHLLPKGVPGRRLHGCELVGGGAVPVIRGAGGRSRRVRRWISRAPRPRRANQWGRRGGVRWVAEGRGVASGSLATDHGGDGQLGFGSVARCTH
jgi:hypothetical protein